MTKLRASDGANMGTFPTGNGPLGVAFDGANIWVTNGLGGTVSKLQVKVTRLCRVTARAP